MSQLIGFAQLAAVFLLVHLWGAVRGLGAAVVLWFIHAWGYSRGYNAAAAAYYRQERQAAQLEQWWAKRRKRG